MKTLLKTDTSRLQIVSVVCFLISAATASLAANYFSNDQLPTCTIQIGEKVYRLSPTQTGDFPQVSGIAALATVPMRVTYPSAEKKGKVILEVMDGGKIDGKRLKVVELDETRTLSFEFQVSADLGIYRVTVRKGNGEAYRIRLWVESKEVNKK